MSRVFIRQARSLTQLLRPCLARTYAHHRKPARRPAPQLQQPSLLPRDPQAVVSQAHEKERFAFRYAVEEGDITAAYKIYIEQRDVPFLSGGEVTSIIQLISADATRRSLTSPEAQPESIKEVFWTIIDDVREERINGLAMLWVYGLEALATWRNYDEAEELWAWLKALPNRQEIDRTAHCIDSRVYGQMLRLRLGKGAPLDELRALYEEAMVEREMKPSVFMAQAMINALLKYGEIGEAYKLLDRTIETQRRFIRPQFYSSILQSAIETGNLGVSVEIFMKACNSNSAPGPAQISILLAELTKARHSLEVIVKVFERYREVRGQYLPMHNVNAVISAIFGTARDGATTMEILTRVHALIKQCKDEGSNPNIATVNILLAGYTELGQIEMVDDLMSRSSLNDNSFRSILKALKLRHASLDEIQEVWKRFCAFKEETATEFVARDMQMLMRACFASTEKDAIGWFSTVLTTVLDSAQGNGQDWRLLNFELGQLTKSEFGDSGDQQATENDTSSVDIRQSSHT